MILTIGHSKTIETFLKTAALKRKFTVIVAETAPSYVLPTPTSTTAEGACRFKGREMALALSAASIETILVPDACIFALMSRVNKVILGAHAVLADGSFFGISGSLPACRIAKAHLVPVIVCTGLYKLCPVFLGADLGQLDDRCPDEVLDTDGQQLDLVQVKNPFYDKVPAELVSLFITNACVRSRPRLSLLTSRQRRASIFRVLSAAYRPVRCIIHAYRLLQQQVEASGPPPSDPCESKGANRILRYADEVLPGHRRVSRTCASLSKTVHVPRMPSFLDNSTPDMAQVSEPFSSTTKSQSGSRSGPS
jgi:hypothetical protein